MQKLTLTLVEDDVDIRTVLATYLKSCQEFGQVAAVESVEQLERAVAGGLVPDVALMDIQLPGKSGIEGIRLLKSRFEKTDIIMLTVFNDEHRIFDSLCAGATGYLLKSTPLAEIRQGILTLNHGGAPMSPQIARKVIHFFNQYPARWGSQALLTDRERQIVDGLVQGLSYKLIAEAQCISINTVRFHIKSIYSKLQVNSKGEVIAKVLKGRV